MVVQYINSTETN